MNSDGKWALGGVSRVPQARVFTLIAGILSDSRQFLSACCRSARRVLETGWTETGVEARPSQNKEIIHDISLSTC